MKKKLSREKSGGEHNPMSENFVARRSNQERKSEREVPESLQPPQKVGACPVSLARELSSGNQRRSSKRRKLKQLCGGQPPDRVGIVEKETWSRLETLCKAAAARFPSELSPKAGLGSVLDTVKYASPKRVRFEVDKEEPQSGGSKADDDLVNSTFVCMDHEEELSQFRRHVNSVNVLGPVPGLDQTKQQQSNCQLTENGNSLQRKRKRTIIKSAMQPSQCAGVFGADMPPSEGTSLRGRMEKFLLEKHLTAKRWTQRHDSLKADFPQNSGEKQLENGYMPINLPREHRQQMLPRSSDHNAELPHLFSQLPPHFQSRGIAPPPGMRQAASAPPSRRFRSADVPLHSYPMWEKKASPQTSFYNQHPTHMKPYMEHMDGRPRFQWVPPPRLPTRLQRRPSRMPLLSSSFSSKLPVPIAADFSVPQSPSTIYQPEKRAPKFILRLVDMLDGKHKDVCEWSEDGCSFSVVNSAEFRELRSKHVSSPKFGSFVRQLHIYGFRRQKIHNAQNPGMDSFKFWHPDFQRGKPEKYACLERRNTHCPKPEDSQKGAMQNLQKAPMQDYQNGPMQCADNNHSHAVNALLADYRAMTTRLQMTKSISSTIRGAVSAIQKKFHQNFASCSFGFTPMWPQG